MKKPNFEIGDVITDSSKLYLIVRKEKKYVNALRQDLFPVVIQKSDFGNYKYYETVNMEFLKNYISGEVDINVEYGTADIN